MMNSSVETTAGDMPMSRGAAAKPERRSYTMLLVGWLLLIALGFVGAKLYTDHVKTQIAKEVAAQTEKQLLTIQEDYQKQLTQVSADMTQMQTKVDKLNELLSFVKDNASSKTDNSNQLYTQLADVKKKLDELKANLDMLK